MKQLVIMSGFRGKVPGCLIFKTKQRKKGLCSDERLRNNTCT